MNELKKSSRTIEGPAVLLTALSRNSHRRIQEPIPSVTPFQAA
jgi:hypothetical protein